LSNLRRWLPVAPAALIYLSAFALPVLFFFVLSFWSARAMRSREFTRQLYRDLAEIRRCDRRDDLIALTTAVDDHVPLPSPI
jgi:ABC-type sugar transport system permease subunit